MQPINPSDLSPEQRDELILQLFEHVATLSSEQWIASFADGLYEDARDAVLNSIEQIERLDPGNRKLVWLGGIPVSFEESVERISTAYPTLPRVLIRSHLFG